MFSIFDFQKGTHLIFSPVLKILGWWFLRSPEAFYAVYSLLPGGQFIARWVCNACKDLGHYSCERFSLAMSMPSLYKVHEYIPVPKELTLVRGKTEEGPFSDLFMYPYKTASKIATWERRSIASTICYFYFWLWLPLVKLPIVRMETWTNYGGAITQPNFVVFNLTLPRDAQNKTERVVREASRSMGTAQGNSSSSGNVDAEKEKKIVEKIDNFPPQRSNW